MKTSKIILFIVAMAPFWGKAQDYAVSINPLSPIAEETAVVSWSAPLGADTGTDRVVVYPLWFPLSATTLFTTAYRKNTGNVDVVFSEPGDYVIQYFNKNGVGLSAPLPFLVQTNVGAYILKVSTNQGVINTQLTVTWQSKTNLDITGDVVGYYSVVNPTALVQRVAVNKAHSGIVYFTPARPGVYIFGYFEEGKIGKIMSPVTVAIDPAPVEPTITLTNNKLVLRWQGYSGATYRVLASTNAVSPTSAWTEAKRLNGAYATLSFTSAIDGLQKFFVVKETWP